MIELIFERAGEYTFIRIEGHKVLFSTSTAYNQAAGIEGLKLDYQGVISQFPELKGHSLWRQEAIELFKEHIKKLDKEPLIAEYLQKDLKNYGYKPLYKKEKGRRIHKLCP